MTSADQACNWPTSPTSPSRSADFHDAEQELSRQPTKLIRGPLKRIACLLTALAMAFQAVAVAFDHGDGEVWSRDGNGNVTTHAYYRDVGFYIQESKSYTYDDANRLTLVNYGGGGMTNVEFEYDDADRMVEMADAKNLPPHMR